MYKVYIKKDQSDRVIEINSSAFLTDVTGWIQIDECEGDRCHHAQGNYLDGGLTEQHGIPRYKLVNGEAIERAQAEIDADIAAQPAPEPSPQEQTDALMLNHEERLIYLELGVNNNAVSGS